MDTHLGRRSSRSAAGFPIVWNRPLQFILAALIIPVLFLSGPAQAHAQASPIRVLDSSARVRFSEEITFFLSASAPAPFHEVMLFYRLGNSRIISRAYPDFSRSQEIEVQWTWELEPGALPPGSEIVFYWQLTDAMGHQLKTEERIVRYDDDRFEWKETSKGQVRVFTYGKRDGTALLNSALSQIASLQEEIGISLEKPIRIYVYANRSDMRRALPSRSARYDEMTVTLGMVVADDTLLLLGDAPNLEKTLAHELSHIVVGLATKNPLADIPRWLDEGLAMYAEGELPAVNRQALERAIRSDDLISVRSLSGYSGDPEKVDLFYAESYSLISFMLEEFGRDKMKDLLMAFKKGMYQEDALMEVYGFGLDELDARWRAHLGLAPRQMAPAETSPAPSSTANEFEELCPAGLLPALMFVGLAWIVQRRTMST